MLIMGDCFDEMRKLIKNNIKVDMVLTDPPYNISNCKWDITMDLDKLWDLLNQIKKENAPVILFGNEPFSSKVRLSNLKNYKYDIIWNKEVRTGHLNAKKQPLRQYENIMVFYNKQCTYNPIMWEGKEECHYSKTRKFDKDINTSIYHAHHETEPIFTKNKYPTNIISYNARKKECNNINRVHPTQKPVDLLEYLISTFTNENDVVLDFTMGSGSTGVACNHLNRKFIGIELNEDYFNIAQERIKNE